MTKVALLILSAFLISVEPTEEHVKPSKEVFLPYLISAVNKHNGRHFSTGTIINECWVLIAAHSVRSFVPSPDYMEVVIRTDLQFNRTNKYDVEEVIVHEKWNHFNTQNDVALLKLASPITFDEKVQPIPIGTEDVGTNVDVDLVGYGFDPEDLYFYSLKTISNEQCAEDYPLQLITENQMCTSTRYGQVPCFADSTGPLVGNGTQVGIFSYNYRCPDGKPYILTRLSRYIDWIDVTINDKNV